MCDSERGDLFFHEVGAVVGHLTERRCVSSLEQSCSLDRWCVSSVWSLKFTVPSLLVSFILFLVVVVYAQYLLLHVPEVKMAETARSNLRPGASHLIISLLTTNPSCVIDFVHLICQLSPHSDNAFIFYEQCLSVIMTQEKSCKSDSCKYFS